MSNYKRLYRSRNNRMVAGVCAGLGDYFNIDPTLVRLFFVLGTFFGLGSLLVVYIILMFVVPEEQGFPSVVTPPTVEPVEPVEVEPPDTENV